MEAAGQALSTIGEGAAAPRWGFLRHVEWWAFLALVWAPVLCFVALPVVALLVPQARTLWLAIPWTVTLLLVARWLHRNLRIGKHDESASGETDTSKKVIVVGAGPIGLATVKELRAAGVLDVICFECAEGLGGVYRYDPDRPGGVWPGTRLTSSPWVTAFSDFPPESRSHAHWLHDEYLAYLERYAEHFDLGEHLRFGHEVVEVARAGDGWRVRVRRLEDGEESEHLCDHVAVCSGLNLAPLAPELEGAGAFDGEVQHLAAYKGSAPFRDARVVVLGMGESAVDVAHELAGVATSVSLSMRRGKFVIPRVNPLNGFANDYDTNRLRYSTPTAMRNLYMLLKRWACAGSSRMDPRARLRLSLLRASGAGPMSQPATKSDEFLDDVLEGRVKLRPAIARLEAHRVVYEDGSVEDADVVLLGTGYRPSFPFLDWGEVEPRHPGSMYLNVFVPEWGASAAFLGCARPTIGAIPPTGELQARYFARLVVGAATLPSLDEMERTIVADRQRNQHIFPLADQPNVLVEWIPYLDRLAGYVGCRPTVGSLLRRPRFLWQVMSGPMTGAVYRLTGPGAMPALAEDTIRSLPRKHDLFELLTHAVLHFYADVASLVVRDTRYRASTTFV
jgi:dimethylaniline monooxygenase (N-oxide forming)